MSFEKIQLPDFVIAELYKDCLVELENFQEKVEPVEAETFAEEDVEFVAPVVSEEPIKYLGENKKNIVVMVSESKASIINESELDFLTKILTACNLNLADIAIINTKKQPVNYIYLQSQFKPAYVLLLGVEPASVKIPFSIPHFQVQLYSGCTFIYTPALAGMLANTQESKLLKSKLWISLKNAFNL